MNLAFLCFFGIVLLPLYFLYQQSILYMLLYIGIVGIYAVGFLGYICPVCATRRKCPGGQIAMKLGEMMRGNGDQNISK